VTTASEKQIDYILSLYNSIHGTRHGYLSQTDLPLSQREKRGGMTKSEASALIDELRTQLAAKRDA
jgi:hypothetical protein